MQYPKISIITPSFNQGRFIEATIKSVLGQEYPDLEYIVVDGGSTDETISILKKYENRLKWISERDRGQSDAINKGIRMSTGDIIAYLNSDDLYEKGALLRIARLFEVSPALRWATGQCGIIDENGNEVRKAITAYKNFLLSNYNYKALLVTNFISQPATFLTRRLIDELGLFDIEQHRVMDYDFWLRAGKRYRPGIVKERLASFRVHTSSKTSSDFSQTFRQELDLSRRYTDSSLIYGLHWLNYLGICTAYTFLDILLKSRAKHGKA